MTKNTRTRTPISIAVAAVLLTATVAAHSASERVSDKASDTAIKLAQATTTFNLPTQPLATSLRDVAAATNSNVLFNGELVKGISAPAINANLSVEQALAELLKETDLTVRNVDAKTVMIVSKSESANRQTSLAGLEKTSWRLAQSESGSTGGKDESGNKEATEGVRLEEIVVTAQKREERLQDVPLSVTVVDGRALDRSAAPDTTEILRSVPGVAIGQAFQGGGTQITIRGATASSPLFTGQSTAAFYVDSVPFGFVTSAIVPDVDIYDLARIEVLRGPQGTLYGASALNGVVRVLTNDADPSGFDAKLRTSGSSTEGGELGYRGDGMVNIPLIEDRLAARVSAGYQKLGGWIDKPNQANANDTKNTNLRLKIGGQLTDELRVSASAWRNRSTIGAPAISDDDGNRASTLDETISNKMDVLGLNVDYDFDGVSLSSMTSHIDYDSDGHLDLTELCCTVALRTEQIAKVLTEELILRSDSQGLWRWSLGGMYRNGTQTINQGVVPNFRYKTRSAAAFGELTRILMDGKLELTGGARYFHDDIEQSELSGYSARVKFNPVTFRGVVTWHPNKDSTLYASYSEGFRSGFSQSQSVILADPTFPALRPDKLKNYEVGTKGVLLYRLTYDAAVYYIDWQDVQQRRSLYDPETGVPFSALLNGESASGLGAEFAATYQPARGLTLGINASWNDLTMDDDVFSRGTTTDVLLIAKGERLALSPEYTAGGSIDYVTRISASGLEARVSGAFSYTSRQVDSNIAGDSRIVTRGDQIFTSRASLGLESPAGWTVSVFGENLNNEQGAVRRNTFLIPYWDGRIRPRTIGVQLQYDF